MQQYRQRGRRKEEIILQFESSRPIYTQVEEYLTREIVAGTYAPGQRLEAVRELALRLGVNPNTAQRALAAMEAEGLVYSERTAGRYVTTDEKLIAEKRAMLAEKQITAFLAEMHGLGYTTPQLCKMLTQREERE